MKSKKSITKLLAPVSEKLADYMVNNRYGQKSMAVKAGVSFPLIRDLKHNKTKNISLDKLSLIADAIECELNLRITEI